MFPKVAVECPGFLGYFMAGRFFWFLHPIRITTRFRKHDNPVQDILIRNTMTGGFRISLTIAGLLILACLTGTAAAISIGTDWKDYPYTDNPFTSVRFTDNESLIYAGGDQVLLRSWDGGKRWGGQPGFIAAISGSGNHFVHASGNTVTLRENTMAEDWTRYMDGQIRAVSLSRNGTYAIVADDLGNYYSWADYGSVLGVLKKDPVKKLAFSPKDDLVIATTQTGIEAFSPLMKPLWTDNRSHGLDNAILISKDGSTIITAGGNQLSSHTKEGTLNWVANPTTNAIIDMACNYDCSLVIIGSQDGTIQALDRLGKNYWTYDAGQWVNAVSISSDASVIAAGGLDGTIYLISRSGKMVTMKKMDSSIRQQSLAITRDGKRIAVADMNYLHGLIVMGDTGSAVMVPETRVPIKTAKTTIVPTMTSPIPTTLVPITTEQIPETPLPPTPTQKSPAGILPVLGALAGAGIVVVASRK
jgi:WD40 repeat protein